MALGEKRNGSVFATAAQRRDAAEYQVTSEPEVVPVVVDDTPQRTLNTDIGTLGRAHNLFFTPSAEGRGNRFFAHNSSSLSIVTILYYGTSLLLHKHLLYYII